MNNYQGTLRRLFGVCLMSSTLLLAACGGGGVTGIDGSGYKPTVAAGPINGFGSVVVNGVHYNTDNAKIFVRGQLASEHELSVGEYVTVIGTIGEDGKGIAHEVHYNPRVTGVIQWLDLDNDQFGVLGQTVKLLEDTTFGANVLPKNITAFVVGEEVTVSGITSSNNAILATRIERVSAADATLPEMMGVVELLNSTEKTFLINKALVDYSLATLYGVPANDKFAVIQGTFGDDGVMRAATIEFGADFRRINSDARVEVEGFVHNLWGSTLFEIDHVPMRITGNTQFKNGTVADLKLDKKVRVNGYLDSNKTFIVDELNFLAKTTLQVFGYVQDIYPPSQQSEWLGTVQVQNQLVKIRVDTRLIGDFETRLQFANLRVGDQVLVTGYETGDQLTATSVYVDNRGYIADDIELQGHAKDISTEAKDFVLFDVNVKTTADTQFRDGQELLGAEEFFARWDGQFVEVRGAIEKQLFVAKSVRFIVPNFCKTDVSFSESDPRCATTAAR